MFFFINGVVAHTQKKDFKVDVLSQINGQKIALFSKEQRPIFRSFGPLKAEKKANDNVKTFLVYSMGRMNREISMYVHIIRDYQDYLCPFPCLSHHE